MSRSDNESYFADITTSSSRPLTERDSRCIRQRTRRRSETFGLAPMTSSRSVETSAAQRRRVKLTRLRGSLCPYNRGNLSSSPPEFSLQGLRQLRVCLNFSGLGDSSGGCVNSSEDSYGVGSRRRRVLASDFRSVAEVGQFSGGESFPLSGPRECQGLGTPSARPTQATN